MLAYGYEVKGNRKALAFVSKDLKDKSTQINWNLFSTGDLLWDGNDNAYEVEVNHETKQVVLNEW